MTLKCWHPSQIKNQTLCVFPETYIRLDSALTLWVTDLWLELAEEMMVRVREV